MAEKPGVLTEGSVLIFRLWIERSGKFHNRTSWVKVLGEPRVFNYVTKTYH